MINYFLICGGQRCGTTFLYHLLDSHPAIQMSKPVFPEPKFFLHDGRTSGGMKLYEETCFQTAGPTITLRGEKSTSYIEYELCAQKIRAIIPDARLIFVLRNPVDRAISNYWFSVNNGFENRPIQEALGTGDDKDFIVNGSGISASPYNYLSRGKYIDYLEVYLKYFSHNQIKVIIFEEMILGQNVYNEVLSYLGVEPVHSLQLDLGPVNSAKKGKNNLPQELRHELIDFYKPWNIRLKKRFSIDTERWTK